MTPPENNTWTGPGEWSDSDSYVLQSTNQRVSFTGIDATISPLITNSQFFVSIIGEDVLFEVTGKTYLNSVSKHINESSFDVGTYAFKASKATMKFNGDIDVTIVHDLTSDQQLTAIGANGFYAIDNGQIIIGSEGSTTKAWVLAAKPDLLSAKENGIVTINSTHNMLVGSIDTVGELSIDSNNLSEPPDGYGTVVCTFSGADSYWFGDEQSWENSKFLSGNGWGLIAHTLGQSSAQRGETIDLTFENGAQWSYLNVNDIFSSEGRIKIWNYSLNYSLTMQSIAKRISNITLRNGGIINLFDEDIENKWKEIGLWNHLENPDEIKHDYVRIGDLKGSDGIFRLDLNSDDHTKSDMVFIESSSEPGRHWIEPYRPAQLASITTDNTLTFALTQKEANGITFADKINIYGETLYDYELWIDSEKLDTDDKLSTLKEEITSKYEGFDPDPEEYKDGTKWFINRVSVSQSAATVGVRNAGWAAYDAIMQIDRRDRRLRENTFVNDVTNDGLWLRVQYGKLGADDAYESDTTTLHVGYERQTSDNNRFGVSVSYMDGSPDFENMRNSGELKRYEAVVYDTLTLGDHYLDFVARFGHLSSDFSVTNMDGSLTTHGDFSMNYGGVSAEYGYTLKSSTGFFAEPQLQIQATRIEGYNYGLQRGMSVEAKQDTSLIGRIGMRLGKHISDEHSSAEVYARADVLHQFTDGQFGRIRDAQTYQNLHWGDAGTWLNFGLGGYYKFADKFSVQIDLEKSTGGEMLNAWMVSGHLNYMF